MPTYYRVLNVCSLGAHVLSQILTTGTLCHTADRKSHKGKPRISKIENHTMVYQRFPKILGLPWCDFLSAGWQRVPVVRICYNTCARREQTFSTLNKANNCGNVSIWGCLDLNKEGTTFQWKEQQLHLHVAWVIKYCMFDWYIEIYCVNLDIFNLCCMVLIFDTLPSCQNPKRSKIIWSLRSNFCRCEIVWHTCWAFDTAIE